MPTIPVFQDANNQFPDAPPATDIAPERFGRDAAALANFGGALGELGSNLMQARKRAMESDAVADRHSEDIRWLTAKEQELKLNYTKKDADGNDILGPNGELVYDVSGFSEALRKELDTRQAEGLKAMPTGDAQRMYRGQTERMFQSSYVNGVQWENVTVSEVVDVAVTV